MATDSSSGSVGVGNNAVTYMIPISDNPESGYAGKSQFIYSANELLAAGVSAGEIDAISLTAKNFANTAAGSTPCPRPRCRRAGRRGAARGWPPPW